MDENIKRIWYEKIKTIPSAIYRGVEFFSLSDLSKELGLNPRFFPMHGLVGKLRINGYNRLAAPMPDIAEALGDLRKQWGPMKMEKRRVVLSFLEFISEEMPDWLDKKEVSAEATEPAISEPMEAPTLEIEDLCTESTVEGGPSYNKVLPGLKTVQCTDVGGTEYYILKSVDEAVEIKPNWFDNAESIRVEGRGCMLCVTYDGLVRGLHRFYMDVRYNAISRTSQERIEKFLMSLGSGETSVTAPIRKKKPAQQETSLLGIAEMLQGLASGKKLVITVQIR